MRPRAPGSGGPGGAREARNAGGSPNSTPNFDQEHCADGLQALRRYQWGPLNANGVHGREPLHNDASHGSDAFQCLAVCAKQPLPPPANRRNPRQAWLPRLAATNTSERPLAFRRPWRKALAAVRVLASISTRNSSVT